MRCSQEMDVEMVKQSLVPGVKHARKAVDGGVQALAVSQFFSQSTRSRREEQVVGGFGLGAEEQSTQFSG